MRLAILILLACFNIVTFAADAIEILESGFKFQPPEGFTTLTKEEVAVKFPVPKAPQNVTGNASRKTTISYDLMPRPPFRPDQLEGYMKFLPKHLDQIIPGMKWKEVKIIELAGQKWGYCEATHPSDLGLAHEIMLFTSANNRMLKIQIGCPEVDFASQEKTLRECINSFAKAETKTPSADAPAKP